MTINQLSIFMENKYGRLNEILSLIAKENIRIIASTVADTSEFGILRIISNENERACEILKENHISVNLTKVIAVKTGAEVGTFARIIECFTQSGISIEYMYGYSCHEEGMLVLKMNDNDKELAIELIRNNNIPCISEEELLSM